MLSRVKTKTQPLERYRGIISEDLFQEVKDSAKELKGLKVVHINSTPLGGGVAEVLKSLVPLMRGVGLKAQWHIIPPNRKFFDLTKEIHNALQGKKFSLSSSSKELYYRHMKKSARLMRNMKADVWIFHDPQPAGIVQFLPSHNLSPLISRIHIDTSNPNLEVWDFIKESLLQYDKIIFSAQKFARSDIPKDKRIIFPPAIDPLTIKNILFSLSSSRRILRSFGIDTTRPLISQISRFDPWKDPVGVIKSYRIAKKKIPGLQLALIGLLLSYDDPEAIKVFKEVKREVKKDKDIFLFSNPEQLGSIKVDRFVNAFQTASNLILQKSIKEGFGLVVAEAMWKQRTVIGGNVGGIKLQIRDGENGFLVSSPEEAARRIIELIENPELKMRLELEARKTVKEKFLMPRLLRDYLRLFKKLV